MEGKSCLVIKLYLKEFASKTHILPSPKYSCRVPHVEMLSHFGLTKEDSICIVIFFVMSSRKNRCKFKWW